MIYCHHLPGRNLFDIGHEKIRAAPLGGGGKGEGEVGVLDKRQIQRTTHAVFTYLLTFFFSKTVLSTPDSSLLFFSPKVRCSSSTNSLISHHNELINVGTGWWYRQRGKAQPPPRKRGNQSPTSTRRAMNIEPTR